MHNVLPQGRRRLAGRRPLERRVSMIMRFVSNLCDRNYSRPSKREDIHHGNQEKGDPGDHWREQYLLGPKI